MIPPHQPQRQTKYFGEGGCAATAWGPAPLLPQHRPAGALASGGCELHQTMAHILRASIQLGDKGAMSGRVCPQHRPYQVRGQVLERPESGAGIKTDERQLTGGPNLPPPVFAGCFFSPRWISEREQTRLQSVITSLKLPPSRHLKDNQPERLPNLQLIKGSETHEPPAFTLNPARDGCSSHVWPVSSRRPGGDGCFSSMEEA